MTGRSRCFAFLVFKESSSLEQVRIREISFYKLVTSNVPQVLTSGDHAINSKKIDVKRARAKPGKIFVGGLSSDLSDETIRDYFSQFGTVTDCELPFDKIKNQRKNFCFITFEREETMKEVLKVSKQRIGEHEVDVKKATPKIGNRVGGYGGDFYGGYQDYYGGYCAQDYYGWGGYTGGAGQYEGEGGGGKSQKQKGNYRGNPY